MTQNTKSLVLGGGHVKAETRLVGQTRGCYVERSVQKATHDSNYGLEFRTDHVLTIKTGYMVGWTFEEINPANANLMVGGPGYGIVPIDRSLPGPRRNPAMLAYGATRRIHREQAQLIRNEKGQGVNYPLTYKLANASNPAVDPPEIAILNTDFTGTVTGYKAFVLTGELAAGLDRSLISNIEIVPYTALADDLVLTVKIVPTGVLATFYSLWVATVTRSATTGEFTFTSAFVNMTDFYQQALPAPSGDGTYSITAGLAAAPLRINSPVGAVNPPNPVTVSRKTTLTGVLTPAVFPTDYTYTTDEKGGGAIRLTPNSAIGQGETVVVDYYYDITQIRELPLVSLGRNPTLSVTLEILFPDLSSKMIWHFFKAQINTQLRVASAETDWMGVDVTLETLDASDVYSKYGFGYLQLVGPITDYIKEWGNIGDGLNDVLNLPANHTTYA